jgi:molybdopterin-guanine dinucleotide biosynthesis protein B
MQPIISIVGRSDSGKTTLLGGLIAELKRRGYKVAVIKHSAEDVELDTVSKDTWRFSQAGSDVSAISSSHRLAIFRKLEQDIGPAQLPCLAAWDSDIILTEGYKQSGYLKIEVHRKELGEGLVSRPEQLIALVTDEPCAPDVPQFTGRDIPQIADLLEGRILEQRKQDDLDLFVDGESITLDVAFKDLLIRSLIAMTTAIEKDESSSLHISLRRKV